MSEDLWCAFLCKDCAESHTLHEDLQDVYTDIGRYCSSQFRLMEVFRFHSILAKSACSCGMFKRIQSETADKKDTRKEPKREGYEAQEQPG